VKILRFHFHRLFQGASNQLINGLLVKPPDPADPDRRDLPFSGVFADGDFVELQVLRYFPGRHDLGHDILLGEIHREPFIFLRRDGEVLKVMVEGSGLSWNSCL
jgi:hypothetical protein